MDRNLALQKALQASAGGMLACGFVFTTFDTGLQPSTMAQIVFAVSIALFVAGWRKGSGMMRPDPQDRLYTTTAVMCWIVFFINYLG